MTGIQNDEIFDILVGKISAAINRTFLLTFVAEGIEISTEQWSGNGLPLEPRQSNPTSTLSSHSKRQTHHDPPNRQIREKPFGKACCRPERPPHQPYSSYNRRRFATSKSNRNSDANHTTHAE